MSDDQPIRRRTLRAQNLIRKLRHAEDDLRGDVLGSDVGDLGALDVRDV
jgi:hypothetical protein